MGISRQLIQENNNRILVTSKDPFLIEHFIDQMQGVYADYDLSLCYSMEEFLEIVQRGDLFSSKRNIVVLWDLKTEDLPVIEGMSPVDPSDIIVYVERDVVSHTKTYSKIRGGSLCIKLESPDERECVTWVAQDMKAQGLNYSEDIPKFLVRRRGANLLGLHNEIRKIVYVAGKNRVDRVLCDRVVSYGGEAQYFVLMEGLFRRRVQETIQEFKLVSEYTYVKLLHFMIGQVERTYKVAAYREQKMDDDSIAEMIGVPKFILKTKIYTVLASFNKIKLILLLDLFNKLDLELRTSKYPKGLVFESYLLKAMHL